MLKALYVTAAVTLIMIGAAIAQTPSSVLTDHGPTDHGPTDHGATDQAPAPAIARTTVLTTNVNGLATVRTETMTTETAALPASDTAMTKQTTMTIR
jgi:hypothetical protein